METNHENSESDDEDEVTFLLRLRPTPSPPVRRRRHSVDCRPVAQTKDNWDVIIQRREVPSPILQRRENPSPNYQRREIQTPVRRESPPPIPPRIHPSAPPLEEHDKPSIYPKQPPYYQCNRLSSEFSFSFPNLKYLENNYGNVMPFPPKPVGHYYPGYQYHVPNSPSYDMNGHYQEPFMDISAMNGHGRHVAPPGSARPPKPLPRASLSQTNLHGSQKDFLKERVTDLVC